MPTVNTTNYVSAGNPAAQRNLRTRMTQLEADMKKWQEEYAANPTPENQTRLQSLINNAANQWNNLNTQIINIPSLNINSAAAGTRLVVPNLGASQQAAIDANQAALPAAQALGNATNLANAENLQQIHRSMLGDYDEISASVSRNAASMARGEIPQDVQEAIHRNGAVAALYGGAGGMGSGMGRNMVARDLGITSLQMMDKGLEMASNWLASTERGLTPFDVSSMFITPSMQFERDLASAKADAAPDPAARLALETALAMMGQRSAAQAGRVAPQLAPPPAGSGAGGTGGGAGSGGGTPWWQGGGGGFSGGGFGGGGGGLSSGIRPYDGAPVTRVNDPFIGRGYRREGGGSLPSMAGTVRGNRWYTTSSKMW